jgi:hypothetical protein
MSDYSVIFQGDVIASNVAISLQRLVWYEENEREGCARFGV